MVPPPVRKLVYRFQGMIDKNMYRFQDMIDKNVKYEYDNISYAIINDFGTPAKQILCLRHVGKGGRRCLPDEVDGYRQNVI